MFGGFFYALAFTVLVLTLTLALSLAADAAGVSRGGAKRDRERRGASQLLLIPQMLLVMLSTGMAPADCVSRLAASVRALPACFAGGANPAWVRHRPCRSEQSGDQFGMVSWASGGVRCDRGADTEADAMSANAPPRSSLAAESLLFASQLLTRWRRQPTMLIQALLFPTFLLITYKLLVGKSIIRITGTDSLYGLVPMCAVAGAMFGALGPAAPFRRPRQRSARQLWVFPVNRASALTGRLLAEAARTLVSSALITAVGVGLGLRFKGGWLSCDPVRTGASAGSYRLLDGSDSDRGAVEERFRARLARGSVHRLGVRQLWCLSHPHVAIVVRLDISCSRWGRRSSPCGHLPKVIPPCGRSC